MCFNGEVFLRIAVEKIQTRPDSWVLFVTSVLDAVMEDLSVVPDQASAYCSEVETDSFLD